MPCQLVPCSVDAALDGLVETVDAAHSPMSVTIDQTFLVQYWIRDSIALIVFLALHVDSLVFAVVIMVCLFEPLR